MPKEIRHQTQWYSNHTILTDLKTQSRFPDWILTIAFYTALHRIEQFLARRNEHPRDHRERKAVLTKYINIIGRDTVVDYLDMYNASLDARYECIIPTSTELQEQLDRLARIDAKIAATP